MERGAERPGRQRRGHRVLGLVVVALAVTALFALPSGRASFTAGTSNTSTFSALSSFYPPAVLQDGPSAYWRLDEPVGTSTVTDSGPNARTGFMQGAPVLGQAGTTTDTDTSMRGQQWGSASLPRLVQDDFTLEVWFRTTATSSGALLSSDVPNFTDDFITLVGDDGAVVAATGSSSGDTYIYSAPGFNDGIWHLMDFTRTRSTGALQLYVDGALVASGTGGTTSLNAADILGLGANDDGVHGRYRFFEGSLDEAAQYPTALSAARIAAHYAARSGAGYSSAVQADSPSGYWRLDDTDGTLRSAVGGATASGGAGSAVIGSAPGVTGDGDTAVTTGVPAVDRTIRASVPLLVSTDFTLEAWFRTTQTSGSNSSGWYSGNMVFGSDAAGVGGDFGIAISPGGQVMAGVGGTSDTTVASGPGTQYNDGQWHQVAFTRVASTGALALYVDGAQVASGTATGGSGALTDNSDLGLGSSQPTAGSTPSHLLVGQVDDAAQFPVALPASRVAAHYAARTSATAYRAEIGADLPAGSWDLDDTTGTTLTAAVGGAGADGYVGTGVQRGLSGAAGGGALGFSRPVVFAYTGEIVPATVAGDFTLECWFRTTSGGNGPLWTNGSPLMQADVRGNNGDYGLAMIYGGRVVFGADDATTNAVTSAAGLDDGAWHQAVVTRQQATGTITLYVDGAVSDTATGSTAGLTNASQIGLGTAPGANQNLDGYLDEVAVYDHVLSGVRIADHYRYGHH